MLRTLRATVARTLARPESPDAHVHFHTGPSGSPMPCFDRGCPVPRLDA